MMEETQIMDFTQCIAFNNEEEDEAEDSLIGWLDVNGERHDLNKGKVTIGRDPLSSSIVFKDKKKISNLHAVFEIENSSITLMDLGSRNKTKIRKMELKPNVQYGLQGGELITFGDVRCRYVTNPARRNEFDSDAELENSSSQNGSPHLKRKSLGNISTDVSMISPTPQISKMVSPFGNSTRQMDKSVAAFIAETPARLSPLVRSAMNLNNSGGDIVGSSQSTPFVTKKNKFIAPTGVSPINVNVAKPPIDNDHANSVQFGNDHAKSVQSSIVTKLEEGFNSDESTDVEDFDTIPNVNNSRKSEDDIFTMPTQAFVEPVGLNDSVGNKKISFSAHLSSFINQDDSQEILKAFGEDSKEDIGDVSNDTQDVIDAFNLPTQVLMEQSLMVAETQEFLKPNSVSPSKKTNYLPKTVHNTEDDIYNCPTQAFSMSDLPDNHKTNKGNFDDSIYCCPTQIYVPPDEGSNLKDSDGVDCDDDIFDCPTQVFDPLIHAQKTKDVDGGGSVSLKSSANIRKFPVSSSDFSSDDEDLFNCSTQEYIAASLDEQQANNSEDNKLVDKSADTINPNSSIVDSFAATQIFSPSLHLKNHRLVVDNLKKNENLSGQKVDILCNTDLNNKDKLAESKKFKLDDIGKNDKLNTDKVKMEDFIATFNSDSETDCEDTIIDEDSGSNGNEMSKKATTIKGKKESINYNINETKVSNSKLTISCKSEDASAKSLGINDHMDNDDNGYMESQTILWNPSDTHDNPCSPEATQDIISFKNKADVTLLNNDNESFHSDSDTDCSVDEATSKAKLEKGLARDQVKSKDISNGYNSDESTDVEDDIAVKIMSEKFGKLGETNRCVNSESNDRKNMDVKTVSTEPVEKTSEGIITLDSTKDESKCDITIENLNQTHTSDLSKLYLSCDSEGIVETSEGKLNEKQDTPVKSIDLRVEGIDKKSFKTPQKLNNSESTIEEALSAEFDTPYMSYSCFSFQTQNILDSDCSQTPTKTTPRKNPIGKTTSKVECNDYAEHSKSQALFDLGDEDECDKNIEDDKLKLSEICDNKDICLTEAIEPKKVRTSIFVKDDKKVDSIDIYQDRAVDMSVTSDTNTSTRRSTRGKNSCPIQQPVSNVTSSNAKMTRGSKKSTKTEAEIEKKSKGALNVDKPVEKLLKANKNSEIQTPALKVVGMVSGSKIIEARHDVYAFSEESENKSNRSRYSSRTNVKKQEKVVEIEELPNAHDDEFDPSRSCRTYPPQSLARKSSKWIGIKNCQKPFTLDEKVEADGISPNISNNIISEVKGRINIEIKSKGNESKVEVIESKNDREKIVESTVELVKGDCAKDSLQNQAIKFCINNNKNVASSETSILKSKVKNAVDRDSIASKIRNNSDNSNKSIETKATVERNVRSSKRTISAPLKYLSEEIKEISNKNIVNSELSIRNSKEQNFVVKGSIKSKALDNSHNSNKLMEVKTAKERNVRSSRRTISTPLEVLPVSVKISKKSLKRLSEDITVKHDESSSLTSPTKKTKTGMAIAKDKSPKEKLCEVESAPTGRRSKRSIKHKLIKHSSQEWESIRTSSQDLNNTLTSIGDANVCLAKSPVNNGTNLDIISGKVSNAKIATKDILGKSEIKVKEEISKEPITATRKSARGLKHKFLRKSTEGSDEMHGENTVSHVPIDGSFDDITSTKNVESFKDTDILPKKNYPTKDLVLKTNYPVRSGRASRARKLNKISEDDDLESENVSPVAKQVVTNKMLNAIVKSKNENKTIKVEADIVVKKEIQSPKSSSETCLKILPPPKNRKRSSERRTTIVPKTELDSNDNLDDTLSSQGSRRGRKRNSDINLSSPSKLVKINASPRSVRSRRSSFGNAGFKEIVLWSAADRQAMASLKPRVTFTGYKDISDEKIVKDAGGVLVDSALECSVLVTTAVKRTCKLLAALAKGLPIVSPKWIMDTKLARNFVDPWHYIIEDKEAESKFGFNLKSSLKSAGKKQLFEGFSIYATPSVKPPPDQMDEIIKAAGGCFLEMPPKKFLPKIIVVSSIEDKKMWSTFRKVKIPIVSAEFVLSGLLKQKILIDEYAL